ncbi:MAG: ABC transporter ATP-binding protein [Synergistaceae bacterium]|nr:ABC transporter ATP-binding protein [Synergistaceae bacterium]
MLLEVRNLKTFFHTFRGTVRAVDDVSFTIAKGEILGIVGESGCGKSVTGFSIMGLIEEPGKVAGGEILFDGRRLLDLSDNQMNEIRGKEISMIFQDPMTSLNPVYTIGEQIEEMLTLHSSLSPRERRKRCVELLRSVGIPNPEGRLNDYPHHFSGGMRQRVIIAIALAAEPKLIVADEPTTALDVTIQAQILKLMKALVRERNCSMMLITHDLAVVSEMADRIIVMYCGQIVEEGRARDVIENPSHPYTQGLIGSIPKLNEDKSRLETIHGIVPNMFELPEGCNFSPRCRFCREICFGVKPDFRLANTEGHLIRCHSACGVSEGGNEV